MNISIIIPNYNGEKLLEVNLPKITAAVENYKKGSIEIIISDDASSDNSIQVIEKFIISLSRKKIIGRLIKNTNQKDRGFSKNVNRAVRVAVGDILLLLNTDVVPHRDFLDPLLHHFSDSNVFAVGCMDQSKENGRTILRGRGIGWWEKGLLLHGAGSIDKLNTLWVSGGSGAFRKSTWDMLGGLNELFNPFYWEDIDVAYRAQKAGFTTIFEKKSIVVHEHSKGTIQSFFKPYNIQKIAYRNQFIFVWGNITDGELLVSHIIWLPYHILNAIRTGNNALPLGFLNAVLLLPQVLIYKQKMRKYFIVSDKKILQSFSQEK